MNKNFIIFFWIIFITMLVNGEADSTKKDTNPTNVPQQYWTNELAHDTAEFSIQSVKVKGHKDIKVFRDKATGNTCYYWGGDFICVPGFPVNTSTSPTQKPKSLWWRRK